MPDDQPDILDQLVARLEQLPDEVLAAVRQRDFPEPAENEPPHIPGGDGAAELEPVVSRLERVAEMLEGMSDQQYGVSFGAGAGGKLYEANSLGVLLQQMPVTQALGFADIAFGEFPRGQLDDGSDFPGVPGEDRLAGLDVGQVPDYQPDVGGLNDEDLDRRLAEFQQALDEQRRDPLARMNLVELGGGAAMMDEDVPAPAPGTGRPHDPQTKLAPWATARPEARRRTDLMPDLSGGGPAIAGEAGQEDAGSDSLLRALLDKLDEIKQALLQQSGWDPAPGVSGPDAEGQAAAGSRGRKTDLAGAFPEMESPGGAQFPAARDAHEHGGVPPWEISMDAVRNR